MKEKSHVVVSLINGRSTDKDIRDIHVKEAVNYIRKRIDEIFSRTELQ